MRRNVITRAVTVLLLWQMVPGATELVENALHLTRRGHLAHARKDAEHRPDDAEHDCSGPYHFCACHSSRVFTVATGDLSISRDDRASSFFVTATGRPCAGFTAAVFRPPIA